MSNELKFLPFFIVIIVLFSYFGYYSSCSQQLPSIQLKYADVINQINVTRVEGHIRFLSILNSRITGYPEYYTAAAYISDVFKAYNLSDVQYQNFTVTVPISYGANLTILKPKEEVISLFPLWPNLVATVSTKYEGVSGPLIYVDDGKLSEYDENEVDGSIVLMKFNTGRRWLEAVNLGAKAVIFIEPNVTILDEAVQKTLEVPLNFPRFYISSKNASYLLSLIEHGEVRIQIKSNMQWRAVNASNIIGFINGTTFPNKVIVLSAYYDSFSVVPSLAPGAEEACGIATLLEIANFFNRNKPSYSIMFVALAGHHQGIAGARAFTEDFFFGDKWNDIGQKIILLINIDLNTYSDWIASTVGGGAFFFRNDMIKPWVTIIKFINSLKQSIEQDLNKTYNVAFYGESGEFHRAGYAGLFPAHVFPLDSQAFSLAGAPGLSIITPFKWGLFLNSPLDTFGELNLNNLRSQLDYVHCLLYTLTNIDLFSHVPALKSGWSPERAEFRFGHAGGAFGKMTGRVVEWNHTIGWYSKVSNALVCWADDGPVYPMRPWWDALHVDMTDENGNFTICGVVTGGALAAGGEQAGSGFRQVGSAGVYKISAFIVNSTGSVLYATDFGKYRWIGGVETVRVYFYAGINDVGYLVVFKSGNLVLLDLYDPDSQQLPLDGSIGIKVNSFFSHTTPDSYSWYVDLDPRTGHSIATVFVPQDLPIEALITASYARRYPLVSLINASQIHPMGKGYALKVGEQLILKNSALQYAENLYYLNEYRITELQELHIQSSEFITHVKTGKFIEMAHEFLLNKSYEKASAYSNLALSLERTVNVNTRKIVEDAVTSISFFALILIPFAFLSERLLMSFTGVKRLGGMLFIIVCYLAIFLLFHPGFRLAGDILMILIGFTTVVLTIPILSVILNISLKYIRDLSRKILGKHIIEVERFGAVLLAFSVGIGNLKKRKVRTVLILIQIIIVSSALTSLMSITHTVRISPKKFADNATYNGILIRELSWGRAWIGLNEELLSYVESLPECEGTIVSPRAWIYPGPGPLFSFYLFGPKTALNETEAILGLTYKEAEITPVNETLISGRWFKKEDDWSCILPSSVANKLGAVVNDKIYLMDIPFKIVGIVDESKFYSIKDLDQESLPPLLLEVVPGFDTHLITNVCIIIQFENAISLGGSLMSIAIKFPYQNSTTKVAEELYSFFKKLNVYAAIDGKTFIYRIGVIQHLFGWQYQIIPAILAIFSLLSSLLGSLKEREQEITIYSAMGLSPSHIASMFFAESLIYGMVGSTTGYLLSMVANFVSKYFVFLGALSLNISSSWVITILGFAILIVISSTIYPAYSAAKFVTPSRERFWAIPTKPEKDRWIIPLPFITESDDEVKGILTYLYEYLTPHRSPAAEKFWLIDLKYVDEVLNGKKCKTLAMDTRLAPYEAGVRQDSRINIIKDPLTGKYFIQISLHRKDGASSLWKNLNRVFVDSIRKQLLLWRTLSEKERKEYSVRWTQQRTTIT